MTQPRMRFSRHSEGPKAVIFPELGERPLMSLFNGVMTVRGSPAASGASASSPPILQTRTPILELLKEGKRPARDLLAGLLTGVYEAPKKADLDKQKLEEKVRAEDDKSKPYSAGDSSIIIAG